MIFWLFFNLLITFSNPPVVQLTAGDLTSIKKLSNPSLSATKVPIVEWLTERDHDFQHLRQEHPKSFVFRFKNIDTHPIILQTVRTSCGCTAATWTETPIAPGDTGEIGVEYDAYQRGEFKKKIKVYFDRQRKPEILWIHGEVD